MKKLLQESYNSLMNVFLSAPNERINKEPWRGGIVSLVQSLSKIIRVLQFMLQLRFLSKLSMMCTKQCGSCV
jgi:hypothetical protein